MRGGHVNTYGRCGNLDSFHCHKYCRRPLTISRCLHTVSKHFWKVTLLKEDLVKMEAMWFVISMWQSMKEVLVVFAGGDRRSRLPVPPSVGAGSDFRYRWRSGVVPDPTSGIHRLHCRNESHPISASSHAHILLVPRGSAQLHDTFLYQVLSSSQ